MCKSIEGIHRDINIDLESDSKTKNQWYEFLQLLNLNASKLLENDDNSQTFTFRLFNCSNPGI